VLVLKVLLLVAAVVVVVAVIVVLGGLKYYHFPSVTMIPVVLITERPSH